LTITEHLPSPAHGVLEDLLAELGGGFYGSTKEFMNQGLVATKLRGANSGKLGLLKRENSLASLLSAVSRTEKLYSQSERSPLITIPAGQGQGKSELIARVIEHCDDYINTTDICPPMAADTWLAVGVTFNCQSEWNLLDVALSTAMYEFLVSFRLIYTWLIDKTRFDRYQHFAEHCRQWLGLHKANAPSSNMASFSLLSVVTMIRKLSGRSHIIVFVDESLRPMEFSSTMPHAATILSNMASLQQNGLVLVFSNLYQQPFFQVQTMSGRTILNDVLLPCLDLGDSLRLVQDMTVTMFSHVCTPQQIHMATVLARYAGGSPRLCELGAGILSHYPKLNDPSIILALVYELYVERYAMTLKRVPRVAVLMAVLGFRALPEISYALGCDDTVDSLVGQGLMIRENEHTLFQPPMIIKHFCEGISPSPSSKTLLTQIKSATGEDGEPHTIQVPDETRDATLDKEMAREMEGLLMCIPRDHQGRQFENFDRVKNRVLQLAHRQFRAIMDSIALTSKDGKTVNWDTITFLDRKVDWTNATLIECFGSPKYNTLNSELSTGKYDMSRVCNHMDEGLQEVPRFPTSLDEIDYLTSRQFYPTSDVNPGFDWYCFLQDTITDNIVLVLTENKFSNDASSTSVDAKKDIGAKREQAIQICGDRGWPVDRIVFRLAAYRRCPEFQHDTISKFLKEDTNILIYGEDQLKNCYSPTVLGFLLSLSGVDQAK
jgi:hypothetical protein